MPGMAAPTCLGLAGSAFAALVGRRFQRAIDHAHVPRLAVEFEEHGPRAVGVRLADGEELDDQRLAFLDFDRDFLADLLADRRRPASAARWYRNTSLACAANS